MQSKVTDEMIARYLSGKSSPEEEAVVLDYLSESDEHLDDFLAMSAAVEVNKEEEPKHQTRPLWPAISAAASVAILIGVGIALWHGGNSGSPVGIDPSPSYAQLDSIVETEGSIVKMDAAPCYAEQDSITGEEEEDAL